jgi:hypothetical protein
MPTPTDNPRILRRTAVLAAATALAATVLSLAGMEIDRTPAAEAGAANLDALRSFWIASAASWVALTALWVALRRTPATRLGFGRVALLVLAVAVAARVAVLATHAPALSDDIARYVFDGGNTATGTNPYLVAPEERAANGGPERWPGETALAQRVNNPEMHTIYLPTSQWTFGVAAVLSRVAPVGPETAYRLVFVVIEVAAMVLVLATLRRAGRSAWWLALYAWHPLPLSEIAGSGHQDVIGIALVVAALGAAARSAAVWRWTVPLAAAALVKPVVVPVAALALRRHPWRAWGASLLVGVVTCAAIGAPLLLADGGAAWSNLTETAQRFSLKWAHFGSVYEPLLHVIERMTPAWTNDPQEQLARALCSVALAAVFVVVWWRGRDLWRDTVTIFVAMVLLSPTAHPWYLLWALVLVPIAPSPTAWVASLTLPWGYAVLADTVEWTVPTWVMVVAYAPVYATLLVAAFRRATPVHCRA